MARDTAYKVTYNTAYIMTRDTAYKMTHDTAYRMAFGSILNGVGSILISV
jgi:hypothetical protein